MKRGAPAINPRCSQPEPPPPGILCLPSLSLSLCLFCSSDVPLTSSDDTTARTLRTNFAITFRPPALRDDTVDLFARIIRRPRQICKLNKVGELRIFNVDASHDTERRADRGYAVETATASCNDRIFTSDVCTFVYTDRSDTLVRGSGLTNSRRNEYHSREVSARGLRRNCPEGPKRMNRWNHRDSRPTEVEVTRMRSSRVADRIRAPFRASISFCHLFGHAWPIPSLFAAQRTLCGTCYVIAFLEG